MKNKNIKVKRRKVEGSSVKIFDKFLFFLILEVLIFFSFLKGKIPIYAFLTV